MMKSPAAGPVTRRAPPAAWRLHRCTAVERLLPGSQLTPVLRAHKGFGARRPSTTELDRQHPVFNGRSRRLNDKPSERFVLNSVPTTTMRRTSVVIAVSPLPAIPLAVLPLTTLPVALLPLGTPPVPFARSRADTTASKDVHSRPATAHRPDGVERTQAASARRRAAGRRPAVLASRSRPGHRGAPARPMRRRVRQRRARRQR